MRHEVIVGVERRRRWSEDQKLSIVMELRVDADGATVAEVAGRHDLTRQHIYQWRRELRRKGLWPCSGEMVFLALDPPGENRTVEATATPDATLVEIILRNGRELRLRGGMGDDDLARLIRLVETA